MGIGLGGALGGCRLDRDGTSTSEGSGTIVGGNGSLDLFHETGFGGTGLGRVDLMSVEMQENGKNGKVLLEI